MGKRSTFERNPRDFYPTPLLATKPLFKHLPNTEFTFAEPCAGDGSLINNIEQYTKGKCLIKSDIEPQREDIVRSSAFNQTYDDVDMIVTNPPWQRDILHDMIEYFSDQKPTWLLFDGDWSFTEQSVSLINRCTDIVPIGRVTWIPGTKKQSVDSCAWYRFDKKSDQTVFHPRQINKYL